MDGPQQPSGGGVRTTYLFLSDVHLGSDLVPHARPWARKSWLTEAPEVDQRLAALLEHYGARAAHGTEVCLVIAGDFLDLVGVSLPLEGRALRTPPTWEERLHGLGSAPDHVVSKIEAIAARHAVAFRAFARFLELGHRMVVVRGNHDVELHWRAAQAALRDAIAAVAAPHARERVRGALTICPWFYAVPGLFYVEHGHEFDPMCSFGDPLLPTCLGDSRRIRSVPFSVMLRYVARPTRGLSSASYEDVSLKAYLALGYRLGLSGGVRIARRFAHAVRNLLWEWARERRGEAPRRTLRARAGRTRFARESGVPLTTLDALHRLHTRPAVRSLRFVLSSLYLDRVLAVLAAFTVMAVAALCAGRGAEVAALALGALGLVSAGYGAMGSGRDISAAGPMRRGARRIAPHFDARYVIMGHTHRPEHSPVEGRASYVNLGHWGEDDVPEERRQDIAPPCTYFRIDVDALGHRAELCRWDDERGPRPYVPAPAEELAPAAQPLPERA
jgi:UDP-2,3-diacylglucosamine pyrophosphatase LpxH